VPVPVAEQTTIVVRWMEARSARDLESMLACLAEDVDFHPLRLRGIAARCRGHRGVREWFARLGQLRHEYRVMPSEVRTVGDGKVFVSGSLSLGGEPDIAPFCALHRIEDGLIVSAHECVTDPDMIERLGLIP